MDEKPKYPSRLAANERYGDVIRTLMTLSTASLFLPVFFAREFLGVDDKVPLKAIASCGLYISWGLFGLAIFFGIVFHYMSVKWVLLAWGRQAYVLKISVSESFVEYVLDVCFWLTAVAFIGGLVFVLAFLFGYHGRG